MIRCGRCGETVPETRAKVCPSCGAALSVPFRPAPSMIQAIDSQYTLVLAVEEGAPPGPTVIELKPQETVIGRSERADFRVALPMISRQHAAVWVERGVAHIKDLGSQQGTFVNDKEIAGPTVIRPGDRVSLGQGVHFQVVVDEVLPATEEQPMPPVDPDLPAAGGRKRREERHYLETLASFCSNSAKASSEDELFSTVLDHLQQLIQADRMFIIQGKTADDLAVVVQRSTTRIGAGPPPSRGILRRVMYSLSDKPFVTSDAQSEKGISERSSIVLSDVRSVICVGLMAGKSCEGMIYVDTLGPESPFGEEDEHFIHIVGLVTAARLAALRTRSEVENLQAELETRAELDGLKPVDLT